MPKDSTKSKPRKKFSIGERLLRLAIVRCLVKDPPIVVLWVALHEQNVKGFVLYVKYM